MDPAAEPRVSVIIAAHNRPELLAEAVASVSRQTYPVFETIVVDDGSTPPLDLGALQAAGGPAVRIERHEKPKRTAGAKNTGIQAACGDFITFLDDDDLLAPSYVETAVRLLERYLDREVLFMGVTWFGKLGHHGEKAYREGMSKTLHEAKAEEQEPSVLLFDKELYPALLHRVPMAFQRTVVRRQAFDKIGKYREGCALQDCDWAMRAARLAPCALSTDGHYLQRTDGQGAASRPERLELHIKARIEIGEYLLREAEHTPAFAGEVVLLRHSLANNLFDLAYHYAHARKFTEGAKALLKSQQLHHVPARWKLGARLLWGAVGAGKAAKLS